MEIVRHILNELALLLGSLGVPEASRSMAALVVIYLLATLLVALVVFFLLRSRRSSQRPEPSKEEAGDITSEPSGADVEVVPESVPGEEAQETPAAVTSASPAVPAVEPVAPSEPVAEVAPAAEPAPPVAPAPAPESVKEKPLSLFERMRQGLAKTRDSFVGRLDQLLKGRAVDAELYEELEELLITADFGMTTTLDLMQALEKRLGSDATAADVRDTLKDEIRSRLRLGAGADAAEPPPPKVIMMVGVNGVGKTTTIGKLASQFKRAGKTVLLGAGDTFRAAAADQLAVWGERSGVEVVRHQEGADPAAVAFDSAKAAVARKVDIMILDTAGRLHTKVNLMEELKKVRRVIDREIPGAPHETLLVLDATTGQNALSQARIFRDAVDVSGLVLTKLDGTAKGGVVVAIGAELGLPVRYVGIGEGIEDLRPFDPDLFVDALFANEGR